ncbi:hypothetical protein A4G19_14115 [Pasteurellaceae bacterium Macca]|nr:hypothetical protein [Pasteurellaceae bacterium Macca]
MLPPKSVERFSGNSSKYLQGIITNDLHLPSSTGAGETTRTLNISFYARNFTEAKSKLQAFSPNQPPLFIKRLPVTKCSQNQTACLASQGGIYA